MPEFKPTQSQKAAIEIRNCPTLVAAGAGSGKTRVLTERLMSYITDKDKPEDIDRFLIITYTRAAAGELRGRIMEELGKRLSSRPDDAHLRRQNALLRRAKIGTIHSFCSDLLRENCQEAELSPDFKILDEERANAMKKSCLDKVMEDCYEEVEKNPDFKRLTDTIGEGRDDSSLAELILDLHTKMQCHAFPEEWAKRQTEMLSKSEDDAGKTPWGKELIEWAENLAEYWSEEIDRLIILMKEEPEIYAAFGDHFGIIAEQLRELRRRLRLGWDKTAEILPLTIPRQPTIRSSPNKDLSEYCKTRRKACISCFKNVAKVFETPSKTIMKDMKDTAPAMQELLRLTIAFNQAYAKEKQGRGLVDYADLEHMAAKLLLNPDGTPTELAERLSQRYTEVMVDEYQDVSRVQDVIFSAVSAQGKKLFLVGDVKQSIYRFRLADPAIFNEKYQRYGLPNSGAARILLRENFRSRKEIIEAANSVFSCCMSENLGDVAYNKDAELVFGATYYEGEVPKPEVLLYELPEETGEESPDKTAIEAAFTAQQIQKLLNSGATVTDSNGVRPVDYGDIAILLRSPGKTGGVYRQALMDRGIPVGSAQGSGFFSSPEVLTVLSLLTVMDNPHKDIPLISVLQSPVFGFSPDDLALIRATQRDTDFFTALEMAGETNERCRTFMEALAELRTTAADMSATETIWFIIEKMNLLALCSAMDDGAHRRENLMALLELSKEFESTGYRGLHRLCIWLETLAEKGREPSVGTDTGRAVQIVSIHRSKGLEYPVVFLCDTARQFNAQERRGTVLVHAELGLGPRVVDLKKRLRYPTIARRAIARRQMREDQSEEMRLLYVAMTRAKERLYIIATVKNAKKTIEKAANMAIPPVDPESLVQSNSYLQWLLCACFADGERHLKVCTVQNKEEKADPSETVQTLRMETNTAIENELERRLAFVYPHEMAVELPSKVTATELKGNTERDEEAEELIKPIQFDFRMPNLGEEKRKLTASEKGVATHIVLQYMDFKQAGSREKIKSEVKRLYTKGFLSQMEAEAVNISAIERLFRSAIGRRILKAEKLLREFQFSLLLDAESLYPGVKEEQLLLQGVVDCCIEEKDNLIIIDYKTDNVRTEEEIRERTELYRGQIFAYAQALSKIFDKPVTEGVLFFLAPGIEAHIL